MLSILQFVFEKPLHLFGTWFFMVTFMFMLGSVVSEGRRK